MSHKTLAICLLGHISHGKSTLAARLIASTETEDRRSHYPLAIKRQTSAQQVQITGIQLRPQTKDCRLFDIIDVPGHIDYAEKMIAAISHADVGLLTISARAGELQSGILGLTLEHANIARAVNIRRLIIAINKMDTIKWSESRYEAIVHQVCGELTAIGYRPQNLMFVPVSAKDDMNIHCSNAPHAWTHLLPTLTSALLHLPSKSPPVRVMHRRTTLNILSVVSQSKFAATVCVRVAGARLEVGNMITFAPTGLVGTVVKLDNGATQITQVRNHCTVSVSLSSQRVPGPAPGEPGVIVDDEEGVSEPQASVCDGDDDSDDDASEPQASVDDASDDDASERPTVIVGPHVVSDGVIRAGDKACAAFAAAPKINHRVVVHMIVHNLPAALASRGLPCDFNCFLHFRGGKVKCRLTSFVDARNMRIRSRDARKVGNQCAAIFSLERNVCIDKQERVILRAGDVIIGAGVVTH